MNNEERTAVLKMVASGKVTPEEAEQLFEALEGGHTAALRSGLDPVFAEGTFDFEDGPITLAFPEGMGLIVQGSMSPVTVVGTEEPQLKILGHPNHYDVDHQEDRIRISTRRLDAPVTIHVPQTVGPLHATTEFGSLILSDIASPDIKARLEAGDISVDLRALSEGTVQLWVESSGTVEFRVPTDAAFDLSAVVNEMGAVNAELPLDITQQGVGHLQGSLNGGGAQVQIAVGMGDIHIRPRGEANDE